MQRKKYCLDNPYHIRKKELRSIGRECFGLISLDAFCDIGGKCCVDEQMLVQSEHGRYFVSEISIGTFIGSAIILEKRSGRRIITRVFALNDYYSKESYARSRQFEDICFELNYMHGKTLSNATSLLIATFVRLLLVVIAVMPLILIYNLRELGVAKACILYILIIIARKLGESVSDIYDVSM